MAPRHVNACELFQVVHAYDFLKEDDQRDTRSELNAHVFELSFIHDHFIEFLQCFNIEIKVMIAYLDAHFSNGFKKLLAFIIVHDDVGRVGMWYWFHVIEFITKTEPRLKKLMGEWSNFAYNKNAFC